ncbi:MAG: hypothetical protein SVS15_06745 [Thermodesulfobacteriota bacterium]|nr:hypothetical protein [Thermodesulfobacteriota bacterium]
MYSEIYSVLISALLGIIVALSVDVVRKIIFKMLKKELPKKTYSERLSSLTSSLTKASAEVDSVLREMSRVAKEREASVKVLESGLIDLEKREKELKEKIALLQNVPIPVADHFAKLIEPVEKRSVRRDYVLFMSGVVVTTVIAIILQISFGE